MTMPARTHPQANLRVLFVITALSVGGAEQQLLALGRYFKALGHAVKVVGLMSGGAMVSSLVEAGIEVVDLGMRRGIPDLGAIPRFRRLVDDWKPDIVHAHMFHANLLARVSLQKRYRRVLICTAHSTNDGGGWRDVAYRLTHRRARMMTNVSPAGVAAFEERGAVPRDGILSIPNGINLPEYGPSRRDSTGAIRWLFVGRLEEVKAVDVLLQALALRFEEGEQDQLQLVGDGPDRQSLAEQAVSLGIGAVVEFAGHQSQVSDYYRDADALLLTSRNEGLPMVLLEAGAIGLPVVATAVGGIPELLGSDRGILIARSDPQEVATGMQRFASMSRSERLEMAGRMRAHIQEEFAMDKVGARWCDLYAQVLDRAGGCASR